MSTPSLPPGAQVIRITLPIIDRTNPIRTLPLECFKTVLISLVLFITQSQYPLIGEMEVESAAIFVIAEPPYNQADAQIATACNRDFARSLMQIR
jgi:hypothetical protein